MDWTDQEWASWGKGLLLVWGLACLGVCGYTGPGEFQILLKVWMGLLGSLSIFTSLKNLV